MAGPAAGLVPPPEHPTYSIDAVIAAALAEDAGGVGDLTTLATCARAEWEAAATTRACGQPASQPAGRSIPADAQATATLLAKARGRAIRSHGRSRC